MKPEFEKYRPLLTGLLDGELEAEEAAEVNDALIRSAELREEYERLCQADEKLRSMSAIEPGDEVIRRLWKSPYHRVALDAGVWLIVIGYLVMIGFGLFEFARASGEPTLPKFATFAIVGGALMLLITLVRERIATHKTDPYKDIER